jgi:hypothetical protein
LTARLLGKSGDTTHLKEETEDKIKGVGVVVAQKAAIRISCGNKRAMTMEQSARERTQKLTWQPQFLGSTRITVETDNRIEYSRRVVAQTEVIRISTAETMMTRR